MRKSELSFSPLTTFFTTFFCMAESRVISRLLLECLIVAVDLRYSEIFQRNICSVLSDHGEARLKKKKKKSNKFNHKLRRTCK